VSVQSVTFIQQRNRLMTHFSERIHVVKGRMTISFKEVVNVNTYDIAHIKETTNVYVILKGEISLCMTIRNTKEVE